MSHDPEHGSRPTAPPLLLIHGLIGTLRDLEAEFRALGVEAFAPDLLGYGAFRTVAPDRIGLHQQVVHLAAWLDARRVARVRLVGHSVGGAIAMLFAHRFPERVASIVNIEGNFSLADAFWSSQVARMAPEEAEAMLTAFRAEPGAWLSRSIPAADPRQIDAASRLLADQPASTLQATARSVVQVTGTCDYEAALRAVFASSIPIMLLAGERSRAGWSVPDWAAASAAEQRLLPGGHLMMLEDPSGFVQAVRGFGVDETPRTDRRSCRP